MGYGPGPDPDASGTTSNGVLYEYPAGYASLTKIGLAAPVSTTVGIILNIGFFLYFTRVKKEIVSEE